MAVGENVVDVAQAELAGPERFFRQQRTLREQFILVSAFESSENGMGLGERNGGFQQVRIGRVAGAGCIAAPRQHGLPSVRAEGSVVHD